MFLVNWFQESVWGKTLMVLFLVAFIGYLVGSITIKGVELGTAGVLLVALVFGHSSDIMNLWSKVWECFRIWDLSASLRLSALLPDRSSSVTLRSMRNLIFCSDLSSLRSVRLLLQALLRSQEFRLISQSVLMSGALTSTPGLAAALDATGSANASIGYGIAYPFGVVGVVLFRTADA